MHIIHYAMKPSTFKNFLF